MMTEDPQNVAWEDRFQVEIAPERRAAVGDRRRSPALRYAGFEHAKNIRSYHFQRVEPGDDRTLITVTVEMSLFIKHHIRIQDGPAVCLETLNKMDAEGLLAAPALPRTLTDEDMLAHLASLPVPAKKSGMRNQSSGSLSRPE